MERPGDRIRAHEAMHFILCGEAIAKSAAARRESRGAHWRVDHSSADDARWLLHITARLAGDGAIATSTAAID